MWTRIDTISIASGKISISDSSFFFNHELVVSVPAGLYHLDGDLVQDDGFAVFARIRVLSEAAVDARRGVFLGDVPVEFAQVGIGDRELLEASFARASDEELERFSSQFSILEPAGIARFSDGAPMAPMVIFKPGNGDIEGGVFELVDSRGRCGVELVCIDPEWFEGEVVDE